MYAQVNRHIARETLNEHTHCRIVTGIFFNIFSLRHYVGMSGGAISSHSSVHSFGSYLVS